MWKRLQRLWRHRWLNERVLGQIRSPEMLSRLERRVAASEAQHTGEIRICIEAGLPLQELLHDLPTSELVRARAVAVFAELGVWDTAHNNGVLIYLLVAEHAIEIVADRGLTPWVNTDHWQGLIGRMSIAFQRGDHEGGLTHALDEVSALLLKHFPSGPHNANPNELPDHPVVR